MSLQRHLALDAQSAKVLFYLNIKIFAPRVRTVNSKVIRRGRKYAVRAEEYRKILEESH